MRVGLRAWGRWCLIGVSQTSHSVWRVRLVGLMGHRFEDDHDVDAQPDQIELTDAQRRELSAVARAGRTPQRLVLRTRIVLHAASGQPTAVIAAALGVCAETVRKWRHRWSTSPGLAALADAKRGGRPPVFTPVQVASVKALACQPPEASGLPLSRWSSPELAAHAIISGICGSISASTVGRWLREDALKPWQFQSWIFIRDPDFASKAQRVLDLYARQCDGEPLSTGTSSSPPMRRPASRPAAAATHQCRRARPG
jgi:transposase